MQDIQNIYQSARVGAGLTQERAAELLDLSTKSVQGYEADTQQPTPQTVVKMARLYRAPWLRNHYCNQCPLGCDRPRPETSCDIQQLAIEAQLEFSDTDQQLRDAKRLLEISRDRRIDDNEINDFQAIVKRMYRRAQLAEFALMLEELEK